MPEPEEVTLDPHSTVVSAFSRAFARQNSQFEKGKFTSHLFCFSRVKYPELLLQCKKTQSLVTYMLSLSYLLGEAD